MLALLQETADSKDVTPAQISMAWMLCKKDYIAPIPGGIVGNAFKDGAQLK